MSLQILNNHFSLFILLFVIILANIHYYWFSIID